MWADACAHYQFSLLGISVLDAAGPNIAVVVVAFQFQTYDMTT